MKKLIEGKPNPNLEGEIEPIQDFIDLTVEGIPQEVIDEIYDVYDDVNYTTYRQRPPKKLTMHVADYFEDGQEGEFQFTDKEWKARIVRGKLRTHFNIVGEEKQGGTFDLFTVFAYDTVVEEKKAKKKKTSKKKAKKKTTKRK